MKIQVVAFGIAKDILEATSRDVELPDHASIAVLKEHLLEQFPAFAKLRSLRFAVNEEYQPDEHLLTEKDEVVIIPPVSGG